MTRSPDRGGRPAPPPPSRLSQSIKCFTTTALLAVIIAGAVKGVGMTYVFATCYVVLPRRVAAPLPPVLFPFLPTADCPAVATVCPRLRRWNVEVKDYPAIAALPEQRQQAPDGGERSTLSNATTQRSTESRPPSGAGVDSFPAWGPHHDSVTARVVSRPMYLGLQGVKTSNGVTFDDIIQIAVDQPTVPAKLADPIGCVAGDAASYDAFKPFFDDLLKEVRPRVHVLTLWPCDDRDCFKPAATSYAPTPPPSSTTLGARTLTQRT